MLSPLVRDAHTCRITQTIALFADLRKLTYKADMKTEPKTPGQLINDELKRRGWTKRVLSVILEMDETAVNRLASDKRAVTADIALALEEVFGVPADKFLDLQKSYSLALARLSRRANPDRSARAHLFSELPIAAMIKRGWLEVDSVRDVQSVESELCRFFVVESPMQIEILPHAAKKTEVAESTTSSQLAWLYRVKQLAAEMIVPCYSPRRHKMLLDRLKPLMISAQASRKVPKILADFGIRFVIVESLPTAKIDGVCIWLDEASPVIGMSLRFDRIDNFWFVLRHELEHVFCEHGKSSVTIDSELAGEKIANGDDIPEEERIANLAASEFLIPKERMDALIARKDPVYTDRDLRGFAKSLGVHPGIAVGQLQHRIGRYNLFRDHLVKIRSDVIASAVTDGWGTVTPVGA